MLGEVKKMKDLRLAKSFRLEQYLFRKDLCREVNRKSQKSSPLTIKALTALVGRLSLSVGWENGSERVLKTVSFNP